METSKHCSAAKKDDKKNPPPNDRSLSLLLLFGKSYRIKWFVTSFCDTLLQCFPRHNMVSCPADHVPLTWPVITYLHSAWSSISDGCQTDTIYTDFSPTFQSVNHLSCKLSESYSISRKILEWFVSYLPNGEQRVVVNGKTSEWVKAKSRVPEGALLAPLLFSVFINDLPLVVTSSKCIMYADDVKVYRQNLP